MLIPKFMVAVLPMEQGQWKWFRRKCAIAVLDMTKVDETTNTLDTLNNLDVYYRKTNPSVYKLYTNLDYKRRGPRSRFGKTLKMAQELVNQLNNGGSPDISKFEVPEREYDENGMPF